MRNSLFRFGWLRTVVLCLFAQAVAGTVCAQAYPVKPVRIVVPLPPGGGNDTIARMIAQKISPGLGQQVVVDNRAGAGGMIGADHAAKSPPDGYTLLLANVANMTIIPNLRARVPYDSLRDFSPVSLIATAPLLVVVHPSLPVYSIQQLVALARAKPDAINYASNGLGSSTHLATAMFVLHTGVKMVHVPYKGLSPAMSDLLSGQVPLMFSSAVAMLPHVKNGRLRAIAMTGTRRAIAIPNVPTVEEAGVKDYQAGSWYGIAVPAHTPSAIIEKLNGLIVAAVQSQDIQNRLTREAVIPIGSTPEAFAAHIKAEYARMARVIREGHIARQ